MLVSALVLDWLRGDGWGRAIRVLAPLGALLVEGWPAFLVAALIQEGGLWLAGWIGHGCQRSFVRRLFLAAYGLRVAVGLPTHYVAKLGDGNGALFLDDYTNDLVGEWLLRIARGDGISIFPGHQHLLDSGYTYFLMGVYALFGYAPLLPKLINMGLAALCAVLIFELARGIFSTRAATLAAVGAVVLPTMMIWSVATLKETLVLTLALIGLRTVQWLSIVPGQHPRIGDALVLFVGTLVVLLDLRSTIALILASLAVLVVFVRSHPRLRPWQLGLAGLALVVVAGSGIWFARARASNRPLTGLVEDVVLVIRHRRAQESAGANSQLRQVPDIISATGGELPASEAASDARPFTLSSDVLEPLGYALLAPAPWQARSVAELGAAAEMPVWYALILAGLLMWQMSPRQKLFVICLAVYGLANWLVLAASEGNLGNLLRHRLTLDPVLLIFGAAGLEWLWLRFGRRRSRVRQPALVAARGDT